jgi:hypothetical protein
MESKHCFVLFPIQYHKVSISPTFYWLTADSSQDLAKYKKAEASFWTAEEMRPWALTLVILSIVPFIVILQIILQRIAGLLAVEHVQLSLATTLAERACPPLSLVEVKDARLAFHALLNICTSLQINLPPLLITLSMSEDAWDPSHMGEEYPDVTCAGRHAHVCLVLSLPRRPLISQKLLLLNCPDLGVCMTLLRSGSNIISGC